MRIDNSGSAIFLPRDQQAALPASALIDQGKGKHADKNKNSVAHATMAVLLDMLAGLGRSGR
jgi:hypothetical protein